MDKKIRVLFVTPVFDNGFNGPSTYVKYLWESFSEDAEIEFHVVATSFPFDHDRFHLAVPRGSGSRNFYQSLNYKAIELLNEFGSETIVHCNVAFPHVSLLKYSSKVIAQINDDDNTDVFSRMFYTVKNFGLRRAVSLLVRRRGELEMVRRASRVICNSNYTQQCIENSYGVTGDTRIMTVHKAVDTEFYNSEDRDGGARDFVQLVFVGSNWRRKGLLDLLRALEGLDASEVKLKIIGAKRNEVVAAFPSAELMESEGGVEFFGELPREGVREQLYQSDVLVLPSHAEAFGVAIIEAMASGLAVIASRVGGIPEILEGSSYGLSVEPSNLKELQAKIEELMHNAELLNSLKQVGKLRAEKFSRKAMIAKLKDVYQSPL